MRTQRLQTAFLLLFLNFFSFSLAYITNNAYFCEQIQLALGLVGVSAG